MKERKCVLVHRFHMFELNMLKMLKIKYEKNNLQFMLNEPPRKVKVSYTI